MNIINDEIAFNLFERIKEACKGNKTYFTCINEELLSEGQKEALLKLKELKLIKITKSFNKKTKAKQTYVIAESLIPKEEKKHSYKVYEYKGV